MSSSHSPPSPRAVHHGDGNYLDQIRLDIARSHINLDRHVSAKRSVRKSRIGNVLRLLVGGAMIRLGLREPLVMSGLSRRWFDDFTTYWYDILGGRPIPTVADFNALLYEYRRRQQHVDELSWGDAAQHVANWQAPDAIYLTFHGTRRLALQPIVGLRLWRLVPRGARVLEYGCSLAPYYYCYRHYFSHLGCSFVLADIPNFPFHYAKHLYRHDAEVEFATIGPDQFREPLADPECVARFDVIIVTTVFEHLDDPPFVARYLLDRLNPNGLLVFDYIKSEGHGLDHPNALRTRQAALSTILGETEVVHGNVDDLEESIGFCIARKVDG
ncbi:MAG: methyltransferase domain-containing protein [Gammaproteobacteria bacterium]|nr:methyltransferase domain-containing protein [Gammaproteobacteria bacterium]